MDEDIIVVGYRDDRDKPAVDGWVRTQSGYEPDPIISPFVTDDPPYFDIVHYQITCTSVEKLAKAVANRLGTLAQSYGSEFSMAVVGAGGGEFKLYQDNLKTIEDSGKDVLILPEGVPSHVSLVFHNHPPQPDEDYNNLNRYPSDTDWATVTANVKAGNFPTNVKVAIVDGNDNVRIYNYADKDYYVGLSQEQRIAGNGLPDVVPDDTSGCVQQ